MFGPLRKSPTSTARWSSWTTPGRRRCIGTVSARTPELSKQLRTSWEQPGVIVVPEDTFLMLRGIRIMPFRLKEQEKAGLEMAKSLHKTPEVKQGLHPALKDDPGRTIWKRDVTGG
jgi:cysteine-S-conjugate beta-lyase